MPKKHRDIPAEVFEEVQLNLDKLCKQYYLEPWSVDTRTVNWRELCLRMAGVPYKVADKVKKKVGRPKARTEAESYSIGQKVIVQKEFSPTDRIENKKWVTPKVENIFRDLAEEMGSTYSAVRRAYYAEYKNIQAKKIEKMSQEDHSEDGGNICNDPVTDKDFK